MVPMARQGRSFSTPRVSRRRVITTGLALGGAAALTLIGCSPNKKQSGTIKPGAVSRDPGSVIMSRDLWQLSDETAQAVPGGTLRSYVTYDITGTLDPMISASFTTQGPAGTVYQTLLRGNGGPGIQPRTPASREILGLLAESYEVSADATTFTFRLRPGVRFHPVAPVNGRTMDIDDWRTSYERFRDLSPYRQNLSSVVDSVSYPDSRTMVFKMKFPYAPFTRLLTGGSTSFYVLPKELNADGDLAATKLIGTDFRVIERIQPSVAREYRRHDDYWRGKPFISRWHYPIIPEYANAYGQFVAKNIVSFNPIEKEVLQMRGDAPDALMLGSDPGGTYRVNYFGLREFETSPWRDERVRIAMRKAIDWEKVRAFFDNRREYEANGIETEWRMTTFMRASSIDYWLDPMQGHLGDASKNFLYDLDDAKRLMTAAGYADGIDLDGYVNGGTEYGTTTYPELVQIHVQEWERSGLFRTKVNRVPYAQYLPNIYQKRDFKGIAIQQPDVDSGEVDLFLFNLWHSGGGRFKGIADPKIDQMIEAQRVELDIEKRTAIIQEFQKYAAQKMYAVIGDGVSSGWSFSWNWVHNFTSAGHLQWLDPATPNRDG